MKMNLMKPFLKPAVMAVAIAVSCFCSGRVSAQTVLAGWDVSGLTASGSSPYTPTASNPNLTIVGLTKGAGITNTTTANVWGANSWTNVGVADSESQAITGNKFVTFTLKPNPGYNASVTTISKFYVTKSATGPGSGVLQWSTNGSTFTDVTTLAYGVQGVAISAASIGTVDLSSVPALQNVSSNITVTLRIVNWGATGFAGTWYLGNGNTSGSDLEIQGTVASSGVAPAITGIAPSSVTTNAGSTVNLAVTATGDAASYYWYKVAGGVTNLITGATTGTLTLPSVLGGDTAGYFVVLSNATPPTATSAVVNVTVVNDPNLALQPNSIYGLVGGTVQFVAAAAGTSPGYQWYQFDGVSTYTPMSDGPQTSGSGVTGSATATLTLTNLQYADPTNFVVVVTNLYGSVTSSVVSLISVDTSATLAFWNFNNVPLNFNSPAPWYGAGTAVPVGSTLLTGTSPFAGVVDPLDGVPFGLGTTNVAWGTDNYPLSGGNKQNGVRFNVSTVGAKNITVSYDSRVSGTASDYERLQYTTNGSIWTDYPTSSTFGGHATTYYSFNYNLTGFPGVDNNPNFGFRVVTEFASTATYGISSSNSYLGTANTYGTAGTVTYDRVAIAGNALTNSAPPPVIRGLTDASTPDYIPLTLNFTVTDTTVSPDALIYSAVSLNTVTVNPNFTFGGNGNNRTLTISPNYIPDAVDAAPILITVTDPSGNSAAAWFTLTLTSINLPPTNSLTSVSATNTLANQAIVIPFNVSDDRTSASGLTYTAVSANNTLVPSANIVITGQGTANPTVTILPATNQLGVASISITVNDNDALEPRSTTANIAFMVRPNTNVVAIDYFNYDSAGPLDALSDGYWQHLSGVFGQLQVNGGIVTVDTLDNTENLQAVLLGAPYKTNSGAVLYSSFVVNLDPAKMPSSTGTYFALFNDGSGVTGPYEGRVIIATNGAAPGFFRLGINNFGATSSSGQMYPVDLTPGSNYIVVTSLVLSNGYSTLWINPNGVSSSSITDTTAATTNLYNISDYELRESGSVGGSVRVSNLKVGTTFDSVLPALHVLPAGGTVVISWADPTLSIQATPDLTQPFVEVSGATSPYTNNILTTPALFYRFAR